MHRKPVFALAGVFLVVALIMPTIFFVYGNQINDMIVVQNPTGTQTNGNTTGFTPQNIGESSGNSLILLVIIEVVFISLFIVTAYYGFKHVHPTH